MGLFACQVVQRLDWQETFSDLGRALQLRLVLALLAVHRACCGADREEAYAEWLWTVLEGPVGACLMQTAPVSSPRTSADSINVSLWSAHCSLTGMSIKSQGVSGGISFT